MKKSLVVVVGVIGLFAVGIVGFITLLIGGIFFGTNGAVAAADGMLASAAKGNFSNVRTHLAEELSNSLSDTQLQELVTDTRIGEFKSVFWNQRSVENNTSKLAGAFTTKTGGQVPLALSLVYENSTWKISKIEAQQTMSIGLDEEPAEEIAMEEPANGSADESMFEPVNSTAGTDVASTDSSQVTLADIPDEKQAMKLIQKWTTSFTEGIVANDFSSFHVQTSTELQEQLPLDRFAEIFQPFYERDKEFKKINDMDPEFHRPPMMAADGSIALDGVYHGVKPISFEYRFVRRDGAWKPISIAYTIPGPNNEIPDLAAVKDLVIEKTLAFGKSVDEQDFSDFHHDELANAFREQFTILQFAEIFKEFINERASLSWIQGIEPVFEVAPSIDTDGVLQARGRFPSQPPVDFRYAFVNEEERWRLVLININVPADQEADDDDANPDEPVVQ